MPAQLFETEEVGYACAPFKKARLAYNHAAGCLNMLVPSRTIELCRNGPWDVKVDGKKCFVNDIVTATFPCEERAREFARCIEEDVPAPGTPPANTGSRELGSTERFSNTKRRWNARNDDDIGDLLDDLVKPGRSLASAPQEEGTRLEATMSDTKPTAPSVNLSTKECHAPPRELKWHSSITERVSTSEFLAARQKLRQAKPGDAKEPECSDKASEALGRAIYFAPSIAEEMGVQDPRESEEADAKVAAFVEQMRVKQVCAPILGDA